MNVFTILTLFLGLLTAVAALGALLVVVRASRLAGRIDDRALRLRLERSIALLTVLGLNVLVTRVLSWPGTLLELRQMVPLVPGAMCAYGVMNATPTLSVVLVVAKTTALAALGIGFLYGRADRLSLRAALAGPRLAVTALAMLLALADVTIDTIFALADRGLREVSCCTTVLDIQGRFTSTLPEKLLGADSSRTSMLLFAAVGLVVCIGSISVARRMEGRWMRRAVLPGLALLALLLLPTGLLAATEALSPAVLHLPHHRCPLEAWTETLDGSVMLLLLMAGACGPLAAAALMLQRPRRDAAAAVSQVAREMLNGSALASAGVVLMFLVHLWIGGG